MFLPQVVQALQSCIEQQDAALAQVSPERDPPAQQQVPALMSAVTAEKLPPQHTRTTAG